MTDTIEGTTAAIERELELAASPGRVWQALTDSAELASWFSQRADVPTEPGGVGWLEWDGYPRFAVRIEAFVPERRLVWRWAPSAEPDFEGVADVVEWTLEPNARGGTTLRLRESGFTSPRSRRENVDGWIQELGELTALLATEPWERGISRTWHFKAEPERVWRAFGDADELRAWWGGTGPIEVRGGFTGWFDWPTEGRFAMAIERVEPPTYLAWRWAITPGVPLDEADEVLRTEWVIAPDPNGGTVVRLLETGFTGPDNHRLNSQGWDTDMTRALGRHLGEPDAAPPTKA
jgi:uncharacterized protein YndB with AHSA1/START domain